MDPAKSSRGGRPWSFDVEEAVETAMRLFWRSGYEGVSVADLTKEIGVAPPSLYAAFGSKAGLYREALDCYEEKFGSLDLPSADTASLPEAVRTLLEGAVRAVTRPDREDGCMISSGMIAYHPEHAPLARDVAARRDVMRETIAAALRPISDAETAQRLARHLIAVMQGISIQARDGATLMELQEIVEDVVAGVEARLEQDGRTPGSLTA